MLSHFLCYHDWFRDRGKSQYYPIIGKLRDSSSFPQVWTNKHVILELGAAIPPHYTALLYTFEACSFYVVSPSAEQQPSPCYKGSQPENKANRQRSTELRESQRNETGALIKVCLKSTLPLNFLVTWTTQLELGFLSLATHILLCGWMKHWAKDCTETLLLLHPFNSDFKLPRSRSHHQSWSPSFPGTKKVSGHRPSILFKYVNGMKLTKSPGISEPFKAPHPKSTWIRAAWIRST